MSNEMFASGSIEGPHPFDLEDHFDDGDLDLFAEEPMEKVWAQDGASTDCGFTFSTIACDCAATLSTMFCLGCGEGSC